MKKIQWADGEERPGYEIPKQHKTLKAQSIARFSIELRKLQEENQNLRRMKRAMSNKNIEEQYSFAFDEMLEILPADLCMPIVEIVEKAFAVSGGRK